MKIQDLKTVYICPDHNEKQQKRSQHMKNLLSQIGFKNQSHFKSGTENYPACLSMANIQVLQENLNDEPLLVLEDDVEFTGHDEIEIENADAFQIGVSRDGGSSTKNSHDGPCMYIPIPDKPHQVRITNMLSTHAIVYISKEYKQAAIDCLKKAYELKHHSDVHLARLAPKFNIVANRKPSFFQSDKFGNVPWVKRQTNIVL